MQKIACAGMVSPEWLGDSLQYYVATVILNKLFPEGEITLICPHLKKKISVFKDLKLNAQLVDAGLTGSQLLIYLLNSLFAPKSNETMTRVRIDKVGVVSKIVQIIGRKCYDSYILGKYLGTGIARSLFSFNAGILGGHTVCKFPRYPIYYETLRSAVRGPLVTCPISFSMLALKHMAQNPARLKRLRQSLQKLDFIYLRGPNSLKILRDYLGIDEQRASMSLDSGFGMSWIHPDLVASKTSRKQVPKIVVIPRKDYFFWYDKRASYESYLDAVVGLILWLSRNSDARIYLCSQTVSYDAISDQAAMDNVIALLQKRGNRQDMKCIKIVKLDNIIDAYRLYASAELVITSRMHSGILALSAGVPALFIIPSLDIKVLDVLSFLGLDTSSFLIDMFDVTALTAENFINRLKNILDNLEYYTKISEFAVKKALPTVKFPFKKLEKLLG